LLGKLVAKAASVLASHALAWSRLLRTGAGVGVDMVAWPAFSTCPRVLGAGAEVEADKAGLLSPPPPQPARPSSNDIEKAADAAFPPGLAKRLVCILEFMIDAPCGHDVNLFQCWGNLTA